MNKGNIKINRINEEVYRAICDILRDEVKDPRISSITSITGVETAKDLKTAKVYVSVLGGEEELSSTMEGLCASAGFIRGCLAKYINLRNTPKLTFIADTSISYGMKMSKMIDDVIKKEQE